MNKLFVKHSSARGRYVAGLERANTPNPSLSLFCIDALCSGHAPHGYPLAGVPMINESEPCHVRRRSDNTVLVAV